MNGNILITLSAMLFSGCEPPMGTRFIGTFQGTGSGFQEVITISSAPQLTFTHIVRRDGKIVCDETGPATVQGHRIELKDFTRYIDSKTGTPLPAPEKFISDSVWFLGGSPFDMLKPFPEHDYYLKRAPQ